MDANYRNENSGKALMKKKKDASFTQTASPTVEED
jgi:hypothetical protein